jgi:hypothetical protein
MANLTLSQARSRIAAAAGICTDDSRIVELANRAVRRLLQKGKYAGTTVRYRVCVTDDCITWPRQIQTIEACSVNDGPIKIRNEWYEFLESGPGIQTETSGLKLVDRGDGHCAFDEITAGSTDRKIKVYADVAEGSGKYIILQGYDQNGNWIRTQVSGTWIDGERVTIPQTSSVTSLSSKYYTKLVRVIKDATNGPVRLYEYDTTNSVNVRALAYYEPDETVPSYRRSYLPSLSDQRDEGESSTVEVVAKLRFVPVAVDNDFLLIGNLDAIEEMVRSLRHEEANNFEDARRSESLATKLLDEELSTVQGDGPVVQMRVQGDGTFGAHGIET